MQQQVGSTTVELPVVQPLVVPGDAPAAAGRCPAGGDAAGDATVVDEVRAEAPESILIHAQGHRPDTQERVLSLWNAGGPGSHLNYAVAEMRRAGWFSSGGVPEGTDPMVGRRLALASALLVSVAAFEAAAVSDGVPLEEVDQLLQGLLARTGLPDAEDFIPPAGG